MHSTSLQSLQALSVWRTVPQGKQDAWVSSLGSRMDSLKAVRHWERQRSLQTSPKSVYQDDQEFSAEGCEIHAGCWTVHVVQVTNGGDKNLYFLWLPLQTEEAQFIARLALVLLVL